MVLSVEIEIKANRFLNQQLRPLGIVRSSPEHGLDITSNVEVHNCNVQSDVKEAFFMIVTLSRCAGLCDMQIM